MFRKIKNYFRDVLIEMKIIKISRKEKAARINERYKNDSSARFCRIMDLYKKELDELRESNSEEWYQRFVEICAEHELDFAIPCNGSC